VVVPLDHARPGTGQLNLVVSRLRPKPGAPSAGTLLFLTGGPGQAGIARDSADLMHRLRALALNREVISVDLRGTGRSGALDCPSLQGVADSAGGLEGAVGACAQKLGPARDAYDTGQAVEDLETVRRSLGIERWAIGGVSYGTYVATRYARAYPDRVERLLLDSLVPPEGPGATGAESLAAAGRVVGAACPAPACDGITDDLERDVARLDGRLAAAPVPARIVRPDGTAVPGGVGGAGRPEVLYEALLTGDLSDAARAAFPAAVRAALAGDGTLLARIVGQGGEGAEHPSRLSAATQVASLCEDTRLPWRADTPVDARRRALEAAVAAGGPGPFSPRAVAAASPAALCLGWPDAPEDAPAEGPLPAVPTLVLSGAADVRTPLENAYRYAARSVDAEVVVVPHVGHSVLTRGARCVDVAVRRFFASLPAGRTCSQLRGGARPVPVPPPSFAAFRRGLADPRPEPATLSALRATLADLGLSMSFGRGTDRRVLGTGLRGGTADARVLDLGPFSSTTLVLDEFQYIPRVRVSGVLEVATEGEESSVKGRLRVVSPMGRADARVGGGGVRLRLGGAGATLRSSSLGFLATVGGGE
jgi:pimeloyl-ACP methyl ester carboxylesterase